MNMLIVEDDVDTASFIRYVLEIEEHHTVRAVSTADEARHALNETKTDLIIMDRHLPDQDGFALCREVKGRPDCLGVPVMFVSAAASTDEIQKGYDCGAGDYVSKPFGCQELVDRVRLLLAGGRSCR
jgi:DNA-binding response OmpR family regulator